MYSKEFDKKIEEAVAEGQISKSGRATLHSEASPQKIDDEELDIVIDGKAYLARNGKEYEGLEGISTYAQSTESEVETSDDDGFNLMKLLKLIFHSRIALVIAIIALIILLWPVILLILVYFVSLFPSGSDSAKQETAANDTTAIVTQNAESAESIEQAPKENNIADDNIVTTPDGQRCRIEFIDRTLYATVLGDDGSELREKEMKFDNKITEFCCAGSAVYVIVNMLEDGEQSSLPFVGLYKVDVYNERWEFMETSNYISFNKSAKKIHLKTANGLAGDSEADGYLWDERDINM
ncbi:MAG: hypothetical protein KBT29_10430 [Prevotellaceae bacterium]|nr:hypothetical protein [Candidatus Minthosoma caballi]